MCDGLFDLLDSDSDGLVSWTEFAQWLVRMRAEKGDPFVNFFMKVT